MSEEQSHQKEDERVDEAIAESFPASDPPSYNTGKEDKPAPTKDQKPEDLDVEHGEEQGAN